MKTKLKAKNIENITFAQYEKEIKRLSKGFADHSSPETATQIFVKHNHEFACGTIHPLILVCQFAADWKNHIKKALQTDKALIIFGKAHLEGDMAKGTGVLQIVSMKGNGKAKINQILQKSKTLRNKAKFGMQMSTGKIAPVENASDQASEVTSTKETTNTEPTATTVDPALEAKKEKGRQQMDVMLANLQKLAERLKIS